MIDDQRILFSEVWDGVEHRANAKIREGQITYVRPNIYINKQISPIFNCVTPESVSLATLARQLIIII